MQKDVRRRLDIMEHALSWSRQHPPPDPGHQGVVERLGELVAQAREMSPEQVGAEQEDLAAVRRRNALRRQVQHQYLHHLVRVARVAERATGAITAPTVLPRSNIAHDVFVAQANLMLTLTKHHQEVLEAHGLGSRFVEDLSGLIARMEQCQHEIHEARRRHMTARFTLLELARQGMDLVRVLDGLVAMQFKDERALLEGWQSVHRPPGYGVRHRKSEGEAA